MTRTCSSRRTSGRKPAAPSSDSATRRRPAWRASSSCTRRCGAGRSLGPPPSLDVHWRLNNSQVLAKVLAYPELAARSTPLPALGASARALAPVDALLLACIHRAGHAGETAHVGDIVRHGERSPDLALRHPPACGRMSGAELDAFAELAAARQVRAICLDALQTQRRMPRHPGAGPRLLEALEPGGAGGALGRPAPGRSGAQAGGRIPGDPGLAQPAALARGTRVSVRRLHALEVSRRRTSLAAVPLPAPGVFRHRAALARRGATAAEAIGEGAGIRVNLLIIKSNNVEP